MLKKTVRKIKARFGYSLMEMLIVIGVIAVTVGIATPAVTSIRRNLNLSQGNEYAKAIYMAAQNNLTEMRSMGELGLLETASQTDGMAWFCNAGYSYYRSFSREEDGTSYDLIVPTTLDSGIRNQQVIIEYHPKAGIVYSVFYYEGNRDLEDFYRDRDDNSMIRGLSGTDKQRKKAGVGYYSVGNVDALDDQAFSVFHTSAAVSYENGQVGNVVVEVPIVDKSGNNMFPDAGTELYNRYIAGLEITLTLTGENGGEFTQTFTGETAGITFAPDIFRNLVSVKIPLDSLEANQGFAQNPQNQAAEGTGTPIAAGDNVSITANVTFYPANDNDPLIIVESSTVAGVNPMFHSLTQNPDYNPGATAGTTSPKRYILAVSNGRHLQNLSALDSTFANQIEAIAFTQAEGSLGTALVLDWAETAAAYTNHKNLVPIDFSQLSSTPHINGNGVEIRNLTVNAASGTNAGLFATLNNTSVDNITLVNPNVSAADATATGALAGRTTDTVISGCRVTNDFVTNTLISGKNDVGGLVGFAQGSTFEDCSTGAIVEGLTINPSNLGGLAGTAKASVFTDCTAIRVSVTSAQGSGTVANKNTLGGLVGTAIADGATDSTFEDCASSETTLITSAQDAYSDMGGFAGYVNGAEFEDCSSEARVTGTLRSDKTIPNNNLGGFVGRSVLGDYTGITVELSYLPQYAVDAGGFAGILKSGNVSNLDITFASNADGDATVMYFGGIASRCSGSAVLTDISMEANALLDNATETAGGAFAYAEACQVTDARIKLPKGISSKNAAGFAVGSSATVHNSYVHGIISGKTTSTGFVHDNSGSIRRCLANVTNGGDVFVANNHGSVKNCYGWVWGGSKGTDRIKIGGNCSYSYFVNGAGDADDLTFYGATNSEGNSKLVAEIADTAALADAWALEILKEGTKENEDAAWQAGNKQYPYPRLVARDHVGNYNQPAAATAQDYRLVYEETYDDGTSGKLLFNYSESGKTVTANTLDNTGKAIKTTEYYLYHRTTSALGTAHKDRNSSDFKTWAKEKFNMESANELYSIYNLTKAKSYLDGAVKTYFPHSDSNGYWVRTADQFANISTEPGGKFQVQKNISITTPLATFSGTLTASNGAVISATAPLMMEMTGGKIEGVTVTPSGDFANYKAVFVDKASGGTINKCKVTEAVSGKPFVTYDAQTLEGVTHSSTVQNESITQVAVPNPEGFSPVSNPKGAAPVILTDCYIGSEAAVTTLYYYTIGTQQKFTPGTQQTLSAQTRTFRDLWNSAQAGSTVSSYYLKEGTYFYEEAITAAYVEAVPEGTDPTEATQATESTEATEGAEAAAAAAGEGTYKFTFSESMVIEMTEAGLENTTDDTYGITLYRLSDGISMTGPCLLQCNEKYLTATGFKAEAPTADTVQSYLWTKNTNGTWTNSADNNVTASVTTTTGSSMILVVIGESAENTNTLTATKCDFYYDCAYKGMGYSLYTP